MNNKVIKTAITFLVAMFILTLISKRLNEYSKAEVKTTNISGGKLDYSVTGEGQIEKGGHISVEVPEGQQIQEINVMVGQQVSSGEVLFSLGMEKLTKKINTLQNEVEKLELEKKIAQAQRKMEEETWQLALSQAQQNYDAAKENADKLAQESKAAYEQAQQDYDALVADVQVSDEVIADALELLENAKETYQAAQEEAGDNIDQAAQELEQASILLPTEYQDEIYQMDIAEKKEKIQELQDLLNNEGKVYSSQDGVVAEINYKIGEIIVEGSVIVLNALSSDTQFRAVVSEKEKELINAGGGVRVEGVDNNNESIVLESAQVKAIRYVEEDDTYEMIVNLGNEAFKYGSSATFYFENKSEQYSCIFPISALREDTNGYYVLTVIEEDTILGTELTASRIYVEVLEKNGTAVAVKEGTLDQDQDIISGSSKSVDHGSRVRIRETEEE